MEDLLETLRAVARAAAAAERVDTLTMDAYLAYRDYFSQPRQDPDPPPPTSEDPELESVLFAVWEEIVDREEEGLDEHLLNGDLVTPTGELVLSLNQLYELVFERLLAPVFGELEADHPILVAKRSIEREIGLRLVLDSAEAQLPPEAEALLIESDSEITDRTLQAIRALQRKYPDHAGINELLLMALIVTEKDEEATLWAERRSDANPDSISAAALAVLAQASPTDTLGQAFRLGDPPDLRHFPPSGPKGTYLFQDYLYFERAALTLAIANQRESEMYRRLDRLLRVGLPHDLLVEYLSHYCYQRIEAEIGQLNILPDSWSAPPDDPEAPLASRLLELVWEETIEEFQRNLNRAIASDPNRVHEPQLYQLYISIDGTDPAVWRRIVVDSSLSLASLHEVVQAVMGWENYHLHQFHVYGDILYPEGILEEDGYGEVYTGMRLFNVADQPGGVMHYEYDFGDEWMHTLLLEEVLPLPEDFSYPICLDGARACPPEDVGGVLGYEHYLEVMANPDHELYEELAEWRGTDFDPDAFDLGQINQRLKELDLT